MTPKWITLKQRSDSRGALVVIEGTRDVPFDIKRVYTLHSLEPGSVRGGHAHKQLVQVIVCLAGSCLIDLDEGGVVETVTLDNPARGLVLEPMVWHEMRGFSAGCVLMVLAAEHYNEADYIRDRAEFVKLIQAASA